jgi:hypothetical protein
MQMKRQKLDMKMGLQEAIDKLADTFSSNSLHYDNYVLYAMVKLETMNAFDTVSFLKAPRRWKFDQYQAQQRAAEKLCSDVKSGMSSDIPTIIV